MKFSIFILTFFFLAACSDKGELTTLSAPFFGTSIDLSETSPCYLLPFCTKAKHFFS